MSPREETHCPKCDREIPEHAPGGMCPVCVASALSIDFFLGDEEEVEEPIVTEVPGFQLLRILGEGASGIVWEAAEIEAPHREVAVKILKSSSTGGDAAVRFEAEMAALALMDHPGIARVFRSGKTDKGQPFFAMERIEGPTLSGYCDARGLGLKERLRIFLQVCDAIGHAHRRGVIHRDLKPSNILIGSEEDVTQVKVIDFGIAKATSALLTKDTLLTRAHQFLGTPAYMSPEQAEMRGEAVDTRSDIYSLGVLLYELLTGSTPIAIDGLANVPYDEALRRIRTEDPRRPSSIVGEVDRDLDWIVMKALEKDPQLRYETADAFGRDIERFLEGRAIEARPPTTTYRVRKFVRRNRGKVAAACAILTAMVAGTIISLAMYFRAEESSQQAREQAALARQSDERGKRLFSQADFTQASSFLTARRPSLAVTHLARSVRTHPGNRAAATKLLYTLAAENWARPVAIIPRRGNLLFYGDQSEVLIGPSNFSDRRDGSFWLTGDQGTAVPFGEPINVMSKGPKGDMLAVGTWHGRLFLRKSEGSEFIQIAKPASRGNQGIGALDFSPDGKLLAAAFWHTGLARVWSVETGEQVAEFRIEVKGLVGAVDFSPTGDRVAFCYGNKLQVFRVADSKAVSPVMTHGDNVRGVGFLEDHRVVSWSLDTTARVWEIESGEMVFKLSHEAGVRAAALSSDRLRLLTGTDPGSGGGTAFSRIWDLRTGELIGTPLAYPATVAVTIFSKDGSRAAVGCHVKELGEEAVRVLDGKTGEPIAAPIFHPRGVRYLAFSDDGKQIAISSRHAETAVWEIVDGAMKPLQLRHRRPVWRAIFEPDGKSVITVASDGKARRWDAHTGERLSLGVSVGNVAVAGFAGSEDPLLDGFQRRRRHDRRHFKNGRLHYFIGDPFLEGGVRSFAASPDGELLLVGCLDGSARVWSVKDGTVKMILAHGKEAITAVAMNAAATQAVIGAKDGSSSVWSLMTGELMFREKFHTAEVTSASIAPDGRAVATGSHDGTARLWWPGETLRVSEPLSNEGGVNHMAFSPDGKTLATAGMANAVFLWDAVTGRSLGKPMRHIDTATYGPFLLWSPDSKRLVSTGSHDNTARVWDVATRKMLAKPMGHSTAATSAALSPDGNSLLFGDGATGARIWDLNSGEPLTPLLKHDRQVLGCAFDPLGRRFACTTLGGGVYLWDLPTPQEDLPDWFIDFAEALGGFRFNAEGVLEQVPITELPKAQLRVIDELSSASLDEASLSWIKWLVADPVERNISPRCETREPIGGKFERLLRALEKKWRR